MIDLDKRLQADGRSWRVAVGTQPPVALPSSKSADTTWSRWRMPAAAAAALIAITAGVLVAAHWPLTHRSNTSAATNQADTGCTIAGLTVDRVPFGTTGIHSSQQAEAVAGIPSTVQAQSYLAMVLDPAAPKLGIGPADVPRPMWVFTAQASSPGADGQAAGRGPVSPYPAGTTFNEIWLVDDLNLTSAGSFTCPASTESGGLTGP